MIDHLQLCPPSRRTPILHLGAAVLLLGGAAVSGCGGSASQAPPPVPDLTRPDCSGPRTVVPSPAPDGSGTWKHRISSKATAKLGSPRHGAADVLTVPGVSVTVQARFQYGKIVKDLDDEPTSLWIAKEDCSWAEVAQAVTDDDGVARFTFTPTDHGVFRFEVVVGGDGSRASGLLWVVTPKSRVVIFDIDGTLTTDDGELAEELILGRVPETHPGASEVVRSYSDGDVLPIYLTGRPLVHSERSRTWLKQLAFPPGPLGLTESYREGVLGVEAFKTESIKRIRALGLEIVAAYGNATTDVCAYAKAGLDPKRTFIVGKHGGAACAGSGTTNKLDDYRVHDALK